MVWLIRAGNKARALALGLREPALFCDAGSGRARVLAEAVGGEAVASCGELASRAELLVLAHKPAQTEAVARDAAAATLVLSLLGGVTLERLSAAYPNARILRAMPNIAVEVRRGVTCVCGTGVEEVSALLERTGSVIEIPESLMDAATAVSGVAPAYVALIAEAWVDAAVGQGIAAPLAASLVSESLAGAAALLAARGMDTLSVRREVTSPGGMTARGLRALEQAGVRAAFSDAAAAVAGAASR
jgi:pyrroline-5-carboxylate reductase